MVLAMSGAWGLVALAYLVGTFPSAHLIGRVVGRDPTREGSRNPGASNMFRIAGRNAGAITLILDTLKGALPTLVGIAIGGRDVGLACGLAAVLGHIFPITRRFRGGKGVATFGGMTLASWPLIGFACLLIWLAVVRLTRKASIAALVAAPLVPIGTAITGRPTWELLVSLAVTGLVIARHHENIRRLLRSEELPINQA